MEAGKGRGIAWLPDRSMTATSPRGGGHASGGVAEASMPGKVNLLGDWNEVFTWSACPRVDYRRVMTYYSDPADAARLRQAESRGEFPDLSDPRDWCQLLKVRLTHVYPFAGFPSALDRAGFEAMFRTASGWPKGHPFSVIDYSPERIVIVRLRPDETTWRYVWTRSPPSAR
jgi:hypothetical protein